MTAQTQQDQGLARVVGLDHVALRVPDLDEVTEFYRDRWGMELVAETDTTRSLASRGARFADLLLLHGAEVALDHLAFTMSSADQLDELVDRLVAAGHPCIRPPGDAIEDGQERSALVRDPDGNDVELVVGPAGTSQRERRDRVAPEKIGHAVLSTPQRAEMEAFYALLGFRVTDRTHQGMSFLRCNADHHTLALANGDSAWLQHVAYDVGTIDDVMRGMAALATNGVTPIWGPGRHGPGNNVFTYYQDPIGLVIEYYGELEQFDEYDADVVAREWGPEHRGDTWGVAGPPPQAFFEARAATRSSAS